MKQSRLLYPIMICVFLLVSFETILAEPEAKTVDQAAASFGYGFNIAEVDIDKVNELGFNWVKIFGPPGERLPVNVMLRIDVTVDDAGNPAAVGNRAGEIAREHGFKIDAYEIGNEVNLDASYGWGAAPDAADYVELLCAAYTEIKRYDADAVVISAGLAPVGRVPDVWEGHLGHNGLYQDDREYLKEMIEAVEGADGPCLDAVGYHNYGFSADFDTPPDTPFDQVTSPETNCSNGFCFRGVEPIYDIMVEKGWGDYPVWSTETGWIIDPADVGYPECVDDASLAGRSWQFVTAEKQAENLAGAMTYAAENYPWMAGVILFNLNFNKASYYRDCEQMRFYGVEDRPAETALREIPKVDRLAPAELVHRQTGSWASLVQTNTVPITRSLVISVSNRGEQLLTYTLRSELSGFLEPIGLPLTGTLAGRADQLITMSLPFTPSQTGVYTGTLTLDVDPVQAQYPVLLPIRIEVVDKKYEIFLSNVMR